MSAEELVGSLPPVGFFDPLNLSAGRPAGTIKLWRESELKHGRLAMIAALGFFIGETYEDLPFFNGQISGPAIYQFQMMDDINGHFWEVVLFIIALIEGQNILGGWENYKETAERGTTVTAELKADYVNGDLGFDPLGLKPADADAFDLMRTKELQNGRLAMLGIAGMVAQELVSGQKLFDLPIYSGMQ